MPILLLILFPIVEITLLIRIGARLGFVNTVFALVFAGILGAGLARSQGKYILGRLQASLGRGEIPANEVLHGLLVFVAGVLFLIPGFASDIVALILVLPGTRHLVAGLLKKQLARSTGRFRVFTQGAGPFGGAGGGGFGGGFRTSSARRGAGPFHSDSAQNGYNQNGFEQTFGRASARDVTPKVIDVRPVASETIQGKDKPTSHKPEGN